VVPGAGNPQNLNRYGYVGNNPLIRTDPTGHCTPSECWQSVRALASDFVDLAERGRQQVQGAVDAAAAGWQLAQDLSQGMCGARPDRFCNSFHPTPNPDGTLGMTAVPLGPHDQPGDEGYAPQNAGVGTTSDDVVSFYHGTSFAAAEDIVASGLNAEKLLQGEAGTWKKGSFFTVPESAEGATAAQEVAGFWGKRHVGDGEDIYVIKLSLPREVVEDLKAKGLFGDNGTGPQVEAWFDPEAFDTVNRLGTFTRDTKFTNR
jgi:hypothetical protein